MKGHLDLRDIPVVVFSASELPYDSERAMQLGAVEFLHKPERDFDEFVRVAEAVCKRLTAEQ
jgi:CheY-like chemotaxis protein